MQKILITFFLVFLLSNTGYAGTIDSLLTVLDGTIKRNHEFQQIREGRIQGLKSLLADRQMGNGQKYLVLDKLYAEYRSYRFDSALYYLLVKTSLAEQLGQKEWTNNSLIQQVGLLSATGMYKEAADALEKIDRSRIATDQLPGYFSTLANYYSQLAYYTRISSMVPKYNLLTGLYRDSALAAFPEHSTAYLHIVEMKRYTERKLDESLELAKSILAQTEPEHPDYALYAYRVASNYRDMGNRDKEKEYLIRSAIADIRNGIKDNASLTMLAMVLYREKHIAKAYDYIQFSLADAAYFKAPLRYIELSNVLPLINDAYHLKLEKQKGMLERYLLLISFLSVFLITSLAFIVLQFKRLSNARLDLQKANKMLFDLNNELSGANQQLNSLNFQLVESNRIKEQYIGLFLNRCSNYIEKLEQYQKQANKMLAARKYAELFESTKSGHLIDSELSEFYETFDHTFLILFPNFVEQLNELFKEEERIVLRKGELLNTELRIFALIRLGITDSSKIAGLLRYSVTTIYNYRVKVKNKALVPRENLEELVMQIGSPVANDEKNTIKNVSTSSKKQHF
jgi:hypothetical protein